MVRSVVLHRVKDYDAWRQVYDGFGDAQRRGGVRSEEVMRSVDDPNDVLVTHDSVEVRMLCHVAGIRPDGMGLVLADHDEAGVVAVEPGLHTVGRREHRREPNRVERRVVGSAAGEVVVGKLLSDARVPTRREPVWRG